MKLCVIIPCFDHADFVSNAVGSALRQADDVHVIVVNDGSRDHSHEVLAQYAWIEPRLSVIEQAHKGAAAARNAGLEALPPDCDLVAFLNSDDVFCPGYLAAIPAQFEEDDALQFTFGRIRLVDGLDYVSGQPTRTARRRELYAPYLGAAVFRRGFVDRLGQFDTEFVQGEDVDYLLRAFEQSARFDQSATVCVNFLRHGRNRSINASAARRGFLLALQKSVARRRKDAKLHIPRPPFAMRPLAETTFDNKVSRAP